jgi:HNH endonuclease
MAAPITKNCPYCGVEFSARRDGLSYEQKFCSVRCGLLSRKVSSRAPAILLFLRRISKQENGCWHWTGAISEKGYGVMLLPGTNRLIGVHRFSFEYFKGPIPEGLELDHICHDPQECRKGNKCLHRRCANPDHLVVSTHGDNVRRAYLTIGKAAIAAWEKKKSRTHCQNGHEYTPERTHFTTSGTRICRECSRLASIRARRRKIIGSEAPAHRSAAAEAS